MIRIRGRLSIASESVADRPGIILVFAAYEYFDPTGCRRVASSSMAKRPRRDAAFSGSARRFAKAACRNWRPSLWSWW